MAEYHENYWYYEEIIEERLKMYTFLFQISYLILIHVDFRNYKQAKKSAIQTKKKKIMPLYHFVL